MAAARPDRAKKRSTYPLISATYFTKVLCRRHSEEEGRHVGPMLYTSTVHRRGMHAVFRGAGAPDHDAAASARTPVSARRTGPD